MVVANLQYRLAPQNQVGQPTRSPRNPRMPFDVPKLAGHVLVDPDGNTERLGDRWKQDPQVVLFLRHFG